MAGQTARQDPLTDSCSACARPVKYGFVGEGRSEGRCGIHAYQWLGGGLMPAWVEHVFIRGKPTAWKRGVA